MSTHSCAWREGARFTPTDLPIVADPASPRSSTTRAPEPSARPPTTPAGEGAHVRRETALCVFGVRGAGGCGETEPCVNGHSSVHATGVHASSSCADLVDPDARALLELIQRRYRWEVHATRSSNAPTEQACVRGSY